MDHQIDVGLVDEKHAQTVRSHRFMKKFDEAGIGTEVIQTEEKVDIGFLRRGFGRSKNPR